MVFRHEIIKALLNSGAEKVNRDARWNLELEQDLGWEISEFVGFLAKSSWSPPLDRLSRIHFSFWMFPGYA